MEKEEVCIIYEGGCGEIVEKKSRFIATVIPVQTEEEAAKEIERLKKQYWDARHNCYAYSVGTSQEILRFSDDGEPSGTAGKPILEVITGAALHNVLVVVTRYFGGVLLGTGGLVRAYQAAAKAGIEASVKVVQRLGKELKLTTNYTDIGKLQYLFAKESIDVSDISYEAQVKVTLYIPISCLERTKKMLIESTNGQAVIEEGKKCYYFCHDGKYVVT